MKYLTCLIVCMFSASFGLVAQERPTRSLEASVYGSWAYVDDLGGLATAPGVGLTFGYLISPSSQLGVTLIRFTPWFAAPKPVYQFSYGLEYKHFWQPNWGNLGPWTPWLSYSLLLDQSVQNGVPGRGMAHHTRLALGTDWFLTNRQRLFVETGWSLSSYSAFGVAKTETLSTVYFGGGWKWLI